MKTMLSSVIWFLAVALGLSISSLGQASPIYCAAVSATLDYMSIDSSEVSQCVDSGTGNIGNGKNDDFLADTASQGFTLVSKSDDTNPYGVSWAQATQDKKTSTGTWSIDPSYWSDHSQGAIGFKFGTGNQPDDWFVFLLEPNQSYGSWTFYNVYLKGGGLSHTDLYTTASASVPEPSTLGLTLMGLIVVGLALSTKRQRQ